MPSMPRRFLVSPALYWLGFVLLAAGFLVNGLWRGIASGPTLFLGELLLASLVLAFVLCRLLRCRMATASLLIWLLALVYFAGFASCLAVLLIALAAMALGSLLVSGDTPARGSLCVMAGLALLCGIDGWLLPFFVHFRAVYVVALLIVVFSRWRAIVPMLRALPERWSGAVAAAPGTAVFALLAIGAVSTYAWLPTLDFDSLAYHLNLPSQLVANGYYQMNAATNVWALAPWAGDVLQAIAWVMGGVEARGVVDMLWTGLSLVLIWSLSEELGLHGRLRWLAVALYVSVPMIAATLGSMQTEGPTAAVLAALALVIQHARVPGRRDLLLAAVLFGLLLAFKVSNLMFAGPLVLWLLWRWRGRFPWRALPVAILFALVLAGSSYLYAWMLTGNPVLPVFNGIFHSPYFAPVNFRDSHWYKGFHWDIIWRVVFHSSDYVEGGDATPTMVLIALAGSLLVALSRPASRALALVAIAALLLPLHEIQYSRYAAPSLALLIPAMLCGLPSFDAAREQSRLVPAALCALVLLSLAYVSGVSWQATNGAVRLRVFGGQSAVINQFAPERQLVQVVDDRYGETARVLILDSAKPFAAEFAGKAFALSWYDPQLSRWAQNADADRTGQAWIKVVKRTGANLLVTTRNTTSGPLLAAIAKMDGSVISEVGNSLLWRIDTGDSASSASPVPNGVSATFDTTTGPPAQTLVDASVTLHCDPDIASGQHIVVSWGAGQQDHRARAKFGWEFCLQNSTMQTSIHEALRYRVTSLQMQAHRSPDPSPGLVVTDSHVSLRRDLTAERDLSEQVRHILEFKGNKQPVGPVEP
jgi:hypothetical protein